ncbi:MAG: isochorismate synthase [Bifidobacteriaceae bacterium]|jgi:menaquinone-specific isochorismate synthase|nr:isochorismate synthase [Bifidobacteriaceae bacterium]
MPPLLTFRTQLVRHPTGLLAAAAGPEPLVWLRRGQGFAASGQAARYETAGPGRFRRAQDWWDGIIARSQIEGPSLVPGMGPLALGSFSFSDTSSEPSLLIVPRLVVARFRGHEWVTSAAPPGQAHPTLESLLPDADPPAPLPHLTQRPGPVPADDWPGVVRQAVQLIAAGSIDKVVLARSVVAESTGGLIDPRIILARLAERYRDTWTFAVDGLIGATPELLARSVRGLVTSRVLAGTIRREGSDQADLAHAGALARSSKDLEEHEIAVASVVSALEPLTEELSVPDGPSVLHLPNVMHLATEVVGDLRRSESGALPGVLSLVEALHPSAAVCGTPRPAALGVIERLEGLDRGRYAGPVGWVDQNGDGEWGLALRCAQLSSDRRAARLWAGGGIVAASDPSAELAETEAKLLPMRQALGLA